MTSTLSLLLFAVPLAACATVPETRGRCDAAQAQSFVGALATAELGRSALKLTRAAVIRWLPPGAAATMDYRTDRLNVTLDARNFITGITCG